MNNVIQSRINISNKVNIGLSNNILIPLILANLDDCLYNQNQDKETKITEKTETITTIEQDYNYLKISNL